MKLLRDISSKTPIVDLLQYTMRACAFLNPSLQSYFQPPASAHGALIPLAIDDRETLAQLDAIPSETTPAERRYLYQFFRSIWCGQHDILEVGPFLGGTTRAIAMGMMDNPARNPDSRLLTYDRFKQYYDTKSLLNFLQPLFDNGTLQPSDRTPVERASSFLEVFHAIHRKSRYHECVVPLDQPLPDTPEEGAGPGNWFAPDETRRFDAVFIDGCKSWFGTKYFMQHVGPLTRPGAYYLFQDYGKYTCFWLPAFTALLSSHFMLHSYVDDTYAFVLTRPLSSRDVQERFPDRAEDVSAETFQERFGALDREASARYDRRARVVTRVQHAAALAMISETAKARRLLRDLADSPLSSGHGDMIRQAMHSPTYRATQSGFHDILLD